MGCPNCGAAAHLEEWIASLIVKDSSGNIGINLNLIGVNDCNDLTPIVQCGAAYNVGELLAQTCGLNTCDQPSLTVFYEVAVP